MKTLLHRLIHDERGFWNFVLPLITGIGSVLGGASKSKAEANQAQTNQINQQNQQALQQYQAKLAALIAQQQGASTRAQDIRTAPQDRLRQQLTANMIQGAKPVTISHPRANIPQVSGGPPAFNQTTMAHAGLMSQDALMRQLQGQRAPDISPVINLPADPQMQQASTKSSWLDKLLGIGGLAGGLAGAIPQRKPQTPQTPGTYVGPY